MTTTTATAITPAILTRARQALEARGLSVQKLKTSAAALDADPDDVPAYTVRRGRQVIARDLSAHGLIDLAARAAGETDE